MMRRGELWRAFLEAADVARAAIDTLQSAPTPANRRRVDEALRDCMNRLAPVIGTDAAFQFEAALQQFREANHQLERLQATQAGRALDDHDLDKLRRLQVHRVVTQSVFLEVARVTLERFHDVVERDRYVAV
jgi:hypothetical protein